MTRATPIYLNAANVQACLSDDEVYQIVSRTLRELNTPGVVKGPKTGFSVDIDGEHLHMGSIAGCVLSDSAVGLKWFVVPGQSRPRDLPRVPATILICDAKTGLLDGVLDATHLTSDRTAAMAVAAAFACGRRPLKNAAVVGAGHIGRALVKFLAATQAVDRIAMASQNEASARSACELVGPSLPRGMVLFGTSDVRAAVAGADVVFTATGAPEDIDLVRAEWLKSDAIVCSLGSCREVDIELLSTAWIVVDDPDGVKMRRSDFREGGAGFNRISGEVASVMSGQLHPPPGARRVHLMLVGLGVLDVALGARAITNARRKSLGVALEPGRV